ncbi:helix-turn-helix domain-containing protein [Metabacillus herbersteinensis]|uniref:Helix-turn-helix domain-containing protein n=2 Tax=Metabacillus herbersteinensis TaxID=283816 RepID=A0ABV6GLL2_9BACI
MKSLQVQIGQNLKNVRKVRGYSLDQLSSVTGVSKGMLAQIERGDSSPTVNTLWKIANGLQVSFSSLVEESHSSVSVVRLHDKKPVTEEEELFQVFPYFPYDPSRKFEIYYIELLPGCFHVSERHHSGVEEYVLATEGETTLKVGNETYSLVKGDSIRFQANQTHTYENRSSEISGCYNLIYYP